MVGGEFFLVGECGLECSGEFKGVPVGEKLCPLVGLWITLGVKLEIEPISEADPVLILEKSDIDPVLEILENRSKLIFEPP
jgi:hypothetical protein